MKRVLIADDRKDIVETIRDMLTPYYCVDIATAGLEVLYLCEQEVYEGLIIDVNFDNGVSGIEVASILRANDKAIKILIFSAIDYSDAVRQQVVDIGAVFCEKPLSLGFVRKTLEG
jgi:CheY-like chemotaxis protein